MFKLYLIKIPKHINLIYALKYNLIILINKKNLLKNISFFFFTKNFIFNTHLFIITNLIENSKKLMSNISINYFKNIYNYLTIKKYFIVKLSIKGIGYKLFNLDKLNNNFIKLKLGYSHLIYYKVPVDIKTIILSSVNIIFITQNFNMLVNTIVTLQKLKKKNIYKYKGIYYNNEIVKLKINKRN